MNYLKEIVDEINQELKNSDKMQWTSGIAHSLYYNIAKLVERTGVKGLEDGRYPVVEDQDGTLDWIARNGKFSMQIYHRLIRTVPADGSKNFNHDTIRETATMLMVVMADGYNLKMKDYQLHGLLVSIMPDYFNQAFRSQYQFRTLKVTCGACEFDSQKVFNQEWKVAKSWLGTTDILFAMTYNIEAVYDKHCLTIDCSSFN